MTSNKCGCGEVPQLPECPIVELAQGKLQGKTCLDKNKGIFYSYMSIPYAKPPLEELRFMPPKPADPWNGTLDATHDLPICIQQVGISKETIGQEDCLYLNVHTTQIETANELLRPVMFHIHRGLFVQGSGNTELLGAEFLMTQGVILITINFRLGPLGFASSSNNSIGVYGNMGLKDQVMALKWTKDNIAKFGGNPDNITIFGGICVGFHILSPMSKNLFHKALSMTGNALCAWGNGRKGTLEIKAKLLNISTSSKEDMLKALQALPVKDILDTQEKHRIIVQIHELYDNGAVVETQTNQEAFLPAAPLDIYKSGNYNHVPFVLGYKNLDGFFTEILTKMHTGKSYLLTDMTYVIPNDLKLRSEDKDIVKEKIKKFYFDKEEPSLDNLQKYYNLATDVWFSVAVGRALKAHLDNNDRIYLYRFSADTELNVFKKMVPGSDNYPGACYIDDNGYIFKTKYTPKLRCGSKEEQAIDTIVALYTNFAKFGKPTNFDSSVKWLPATKLRWNYLEIDTTLKIGVFPDKDRFQFWEDIYKNYDKNTLTCKSCTCSTPVIVEIAGGKMQGKLCKDRYDNSFYSFLKVPYAKPPIGRRRFMAPQPIRAWCGVYNAGTESPLAVQHKGFTKEIIGQEDCLYLNVHTPELPNDNDVLRPVMFYIHGDGFIEGSGNTEYLGADFLMPYGIVLVTVNYRLGILGFGSSTTNSIKVTGNMGLKDQTLALKWVNSNIQHFGGDPNNVTIFGEGAGAACAHLHMLSPMSRCLFHKIFAMSGSAINSINIGVKGSLEIKAATLNIPTDDKSKMLKLLQDLPVEELMKTVLDHSNLITSIHTPFESSPVIETQKKNPAFLPASPIDILKSGTYSHVPLIIGQTNFEGVIMELASKLFAKKIFYYKDFKMAIPTDLNVPEDAKSAVAQKIKQFYYGKDTPSLKNLRKYTNLVSDIWFNNGIRNAIKIHVMNGDTVYFYNFTADTELNYLKRMHADTINLPGACHQDDLGYIFKTIVTPKFEFGSTEDKAMNRAITLWTNFAKYGKPTTFDSSILWFPVTAAKMHCLEIGTHSSTAIQFLDPDCFLFWEELYAKYGKIWKETVADI